jgi:hypothetical protein
MRVIISWSGERSKKIAIAVRRFLKLAIQATEPWVSEKDIGAGSFWHQELWEQLKSAKAGIICVTPEMLDSKWVHFEAGVLAKAFGQVCVCPYLFDMKPSDIQGPLAHLQCVVANKPDTLKMLEAINERLEEKSLSAEDLHDAFEAHWSALETQLKGIPKPPDANKPPTRTDRDLLEELLGAVRQLQSQFDLGRKEVASLGNQAQRVFSLASQPIALGDDDRIVVMSGGGLRSAIDLRKVLPDSGIAGIIQPTQPQDPGKASAVKMKSPSGDKKEPPKH